MFSFLRKPTRSTVTRQSTRTSRLAKAWLGVNRLEAREVPATFTVTNLLDGPVASAGALPGSLRQAIFDANALAGADIIDMTGVMGTISMSSSAGSVTTLAADITSTSATSLTVTDATGFLTGMQLSIDTEVMLISGVAGTTLSVVRGQNGTTPSTHGVGATVTSSPDFGITGSTTINGPGANKLTIDAGGNSRHFIVSDGSASVINVAMNNLRLIGGVAPNGSGGSIRIYSENVALDSMVLTGNNATALSFQQGGGAIAGEAGTILSINNTTIANNTASGNGGAIHFGFPAKTGPYNQLTINNSTLSGNVANLRGGAVSFNHYTGQFGGSVNIQNTTISNNKSLTEFAGGLYITGTPSWMTLYNSTVANNVALNSPGGGGLVLNNGSGTMYIVNSVIANNGNIATAPDLLQFSSPKFVAINSIIGSTAGATGFVNVSGNVIGPANLAILANNGGLTQTLMPLPGVNAAVDAGISSFQFTTLSAAAGVADTTIKVTANTNLSVGAYIKIDSEVMRITAISSSTVTVNRAQEGTTAASHASAAGVLLNFGLTANDQRGTGFARVQGAKVDIGAVEVNPTAPWAVASAPNIVTVGGTSVTVNVVYTAVAPATVDLTTIDVNDIRLVGPGYSTPAAPNAAPMISGSGGSVTVTYTFDAPPAPGGAWDYTDNGQYTIVLQSGQVTDSNAVAIATDNIGQFTSAVPRTIVVTTAADSGPGSLRDAIDQANQNSFVTDSITFDTVMMGTNIIPLLTAMSITDSVVINQAGPAITLDGQNATRMFDINGIGTLNVSISQMTLTQGYVLGGLGGAIQFSNENLSLTDCTFTANKVDGGGVASAEGGAIAGVGINSGALTLTRCTFDNNQTTAGNISSNGGAIFLGGDNFSVGAFYDLTIVDSTFTNNKGWVSGGAIHMGAGSLNISGSTFFNNSSSSNGGAIRVNGSVGTLGFNIRNTTITGNTAGSGGGVHLYLSGGNTTRFLIANSTIVNNAASSAAGGGVNAQTSYASQLDFENTILSGNTAKTVGPNLSLTQMAVANNSFISIYDATTGKVVGLNNQLGTKLAPLDPLLAPLANNGGPTQTHRPYGGAPVTDWSVAVPNLTTTTSAMLATGTTMAVASTANLIVGMWIQVDSEIMLVQGITGLNVTVARGSAGTTGAPHAIGAIVTIGYTQPTFDQRGVGFPRIDGSGKVDIGSVEVLSTAPTAKLTAPIPTITSPTASPVIFQVTFADNTAIDVGTIIGNNNAILVTGPNGFSGTATYVTIDDTNNGTPRTATYSIAAPGGTWDLDGSENGIYTISIQSMQVSDTSAEFVEGHPLGTFSVFFGTTYTVTNDNDFGAGSLRAAIEAANNNILSTDTITFSSFFNTPRTITLINGELLITDGIVINGPGANFATIKGVSSRLLTIDTASNQVPMFISGLTLTGGNSVGSVSTVGGGAILLNDEILTIDGCVITGNSAAQTSGINQGGGILVASPLGSLTVKNSTISNNSATGGGGGIEVRYGSSITIQNSVISSNSALPNGSGGGIDVTNQSLTGFGRATVTLDGVTFLNNAAGSTGGGLRMGNGSTSKLENVTYLTITNSTFAGNSAFGAGGGMNIGNNMVFTLLNSTVTGNYSRLNGGGIALPTISSAYGLFNAAIINSVISSNVNKINPDILYGNSTVTLGLPVINSFIGAVDLTNTKITNIGSQIGTIVSPLNPQLGPVVNNGGVNSLPTQLPALTSSLVNAGTLNPVIVLTTLSGAMTAVQTTLPLTNAFCMLIGQYVQIGSEIVRVSSVSGTTVTVTRGESGTTAAIHNAGDQVVRAVMTPLTNLTAAIPDGSVTSISVINSGAFYPGASLQVDAEIMTVSSVTSTTTIQVLRGQQSTTATAHINGSIVARPMATSDQRGFPRTQGATIDIGAVEVNGTLPQAAGTFAKITAPAAGDHTVTISFTDDVALNVATIKNDNAIRVTGPGGFNVLASYVPGSISVDANGTPRSAQYKFTPPTGGAAGWDYTDNGSYSISIEPNQVADSDGNFVFGTTVNTLQVGIGRDLVVLNDLDQGPGSLRQAILDSNANLGFDTITFDPTFFNMSKSIQVGTLGEMFITDPVTITGPGATLATVDGGTVNRIFNISMPAVNWGGTVSISGLTLFQGGGKNIAGQGGNGGAISNDSAALIIDDSVFSFNGNGSNSGGAISLNSIYAPLTITDSSFDHTNGFSGQVFFNNGSNFVTGLYDQLNVTISNSTFTLNTSTATSTAGGVFNFTNGVTTTIANSTFTGNSAGTGSGSGGVILAGTNSKWSIIDSTFDSNTAGSTGNGGAIAVNSTGAIVNINRSTFANNAAGNATATSGGSGGAIFVSGANTVTLDASTLTGNFSNSSSTVTTSGIGGGGIYLTSTANVIITNSTLHGNTAALNGGGININSLTNSATPSLAGSLVIRNSTIAYNFATGNGGGINFRTSSSGTPNVSITSSIVSENNSPGVADLRSATGNATTGFTVNNSFIGNLTGATITGANNKNTAADGSVNLSNTLALNGAPAGSPLTLAITAPSAAIDNGSNATPLSFDQRGTSFSRTVNNKTDMGAFEVQNATPLPTVTSIAVNDGTSIQRSMVTSMTITFSAPVTFPNGIGSAFSLIRTTAIGGGATGSVNVTGTGSGTNVITLTFLNGGAVTLDPAGSLPDGMYSLTLISNQIAGVGGFLDGNMNGVYQGTTIDNVTSTPFHRLFGDADGSGTVTAADFNAFRLVYGGSSFIFDYDGSGQVTASDFNAFRTRYGVSI